MRTRTRVIDRMQGGHAIKAELFPDGSLALISEHRGKPEVGIALRSTAVQKLLQLLAARSTKGTP